VEESEDEESEVVVVEPPRKVKIDVEERDVEGRDVEGSDVWRDVGIDL
jgi:hypothetical protein